MLSTIHIFAFSFLAGNLCLQLLPVLPKVHGLIFLIFGILLFSHKLRWRLLGGFCLGLFWTAYNVALDVEGKAASVWEGKTIEVVAQVATIPIRRTGSTQFILKVIEHPDTYKPFPERIRASIYRYGEQIKVSDFLRAKIKLKAPHGFANPDTFDYERWLMMQGIEATAYVVSYQRLEASATALEYSLERWRQRLFDKLESYRHLYAQIDSIAAITLGLGSLLSHQQREILSITGTHHLFAVSGLHIGMVFGLFFLLIECLWRYLFLSRYLYPSRDVALLGALPAAVTYAALAGFSIPTQRALIMLICIVGANFFRYKISLSQSLTVALLLILIYDPSATLSISFWLSFTAVAMIAFFLLIAPNLKGWKLWLGMQAYIATVMIIPSLLFFTQGAPISPLANMVIVPLTAFLVLPCSLLAVASFMLSETIALFFVQIADLLFEILWQINDWFASHKIRWFHHIDNLAASFALTGILLFIVLRKKLARWLSLLLLFPLLPFFSTPLSPPSDTFKVVFFDVGQGLSVLVRTRDHTLVYDTGPYYRSGFNTMDSVVLPYLRARRIDTIDTLVVSHADNDHAGGAKVLMRHISPHRLLGGEPLTVDGRTFELCAKGQSWVWNDVRFEILYPQSDAIYKGNNASCVLRISNRRHSLLLTADIEKAGERILSQHPLLPSDVILLPHHGSRTSSTPEFISAASPLLAVVTSGYRNRFGLPRADIIDRYYERGIQVLDTAKAGTLIFDFPPDRNFDLQSYRMQDQRYWRNRPNSLWPSGTI